MSTTASHHSDAGMRTTLKRVLGRAGGHGPATGASVLIYHRVGGGSPDERDLAVDDFQTQLRVLEAHDVVALPEALARAAARDTRPSVVLTFDDGFRDVHENAWPLLHDRRLPFTLYLATAYVGGEMRWDGSTAKAAGPALTWDQVGEMVDSGLCTIANHTHTHVRPEHLSVDELDRATAAIESHTGVRPEHFAYPWGISVPALEPSLRERFASSATGDLGRHGPGDDPHRLRRIPVRRTDPIEFFAAKLAGRLGPERAYAGVVRAAKSVGLRA